MNVKTELCSRWRHSSTLLLGLLTCLLLLPATLSAQSRVTVKGTVTDETDQPVMSASVKVIGMPNKGAITDLDGHFTLTDVASDATLRISYVGYIPQEIKLNGRTNLTIKLLPDSELLGEVVVVGYGTQKKENLTGAVASVDVEKTMGSRPLPDAARGLQGTIPGLSITVPTGEVGSSPVVKIRGQIGSIAGGSTPLILVDNVEVPSLNYINPNDIESISVLKDAASSSIYGSKAAFGVILITTKKGAKTDVTDITYSNNLTFQSPFKKIEMAGVEGLEYTLDAHRNMKQSGPAGGFWRVDETSIEKVREWQQKYGDLPADAPVVYGRDWWWDGTQKFGYRLYDPISQMVKPSAFSHNHNLSLNGKRGDTSYNLSFGYLSQDGMMKPAKEDNYSRFTFNLNLSTKINDLISVRGGARYADGTKRYPNAAYGFGADPWLYLYRWSRLFPQGVRTQHGEIIRDPYWDTVQANTNSDRSRYSNYTAGLTIDFTDDWDLQADYSYTTTDSRNISSMPTMSGAFHWYGATPWVDENGVQVYVDENGNPTSEGGMPAYRFPMTQYKAKSSTYYRMASSLSELHTFNAFTTYNLLLADAHKMRFMLGTNITASEWASHFSRRDELNITDNPQFNFADGKETVGGGAGWGSQVGFFGRYNYSYMDKYLLEMNLRYDGTSKFPKDLRWRWYPSLSAGWVVSNEQFMESISDYLSFLKLRASWGVIGDQSVSNSLYLSTMELRKNSWLHSDGSQFYGLTTPSPVSSNITWQDIETLNLGADVRFFDNRLGFVFEWYQRDTKNMIIDGEALPNTFGAAAPKGNYGHLRTRGWELGMDFTQHFGNDLTLTINANIADAITDIVKAADWNTPWENRLIDNTFTTGKRYGDLYGYVTDRLYQAEDFVHDADGNIVQTHVIWEGNDKLTNKLAGDNPVYQTYFEDGNQVLLNSPGDVKYVDVNGDGYITPGKGTYGDPGDRVVIGNFTPRYEWGLRLGAEWKGLDCSIFFQGVGKRKIWGSGQLAIPGYFAKEGAMPSTFAKDYWRPDRTDAFYPRAWNNSGANQGFNLKTQSRYMLDMSYARIKNITLGYTLPKKWTHYAGLKTVRIYGTMENFFTFDKLRGLPIDPEAVSGASMLRTDGNYNLGRTGTSNPSFKSASLGLQITL